MYKFLKTIIISILIHSVFFLLLMLVIHEPQLPTEAKIELTFLLNPEEKGRTEELTEISPEPKVVPQTASPSPQTTPEDSPEKDEPIASVIFDDSSRFVKSSDDSLSDLQIAYNLLTNNTDSLRQIVFRRQKLYDEIWEKLTDETDSTKIAHKVLASNFSRMLLGKNQLKNFAAREDYLERKINSGISGYDPKSMLNIPGLLASIVTALPNLPPSKQSVRQKPKITVMPSLTEVNILKTLWDKKKVTQNTIYADLDTSIKLTAEDLDLVLNGMVDKGLVARKKISPQNIMKVMTPAGAVDVEMSELNRKNPVYEYQALAVKDDVLRFLDARLYLCASNARDPAMSDSALAAKRDSMIAKIVMLLKTN